MLFTAGRKTFEGGQDGLNAAFFQMFRSGMMIYVKTLCDLVCYFADGCSVLYTFYYNEAGCINAEGVACMGIEGRSLAINDKSVQFFCIHGASSSLQRCLQEQTLKYCWVCLL